MPYVFLACAIAAEVAATSLLPATRGFSRLGPTAATLVLYAASFACLAQAVRVLPVAVAYALWAGLGTVAIVVIGVTVLGQPMTPLKLVGVALVAVGVVLLNLGGAH